MVASFRYGCVGRGVLSLAQDGVLVLRPAVLGLATRLAAGQERVAHMLVVLRARIPASTIVVPGGTDGLSPELGAELHLRLARFRNLRRTAATLTTRATSLATLVVIALVTFTILVAASIPATATTTVTV